MPLSPGPFVLQWSDACKDESDNAVQLAALADLNAVGKRRADSVTPLLQQCCDSHFGLVPVARPCTSHLALGTPRCLSVSGTLRLCLHSLVGKQMLVRLDGGELQLPDDAVQRSGLLRKLAADFDEDVPVPLPGHQREDIETWAANCQKSVTCADAALRVAQVKDLRLPKWELCILFTAINPCKVPACG